MKWKLIVMGAMIGSAIMTQTACSNKTVDNQEAIVHDAEQETEVSPTNSPEATNSAAVEDGIVVDDSQIMEEFNALIGKADTIRSQSL